MKDNRKAKINDIIELELIYHLFSCSESLFSDDIVKLFLWDQSIIVRVSSFYHLL